METPYVPHVFGADAVAKTQGRSDWLTVGIVSSIAWPHDDVWVEYDGGEYFLHGVRKEGEQETSPGISTPSSGSDVDPALSRLYRFASVLGYFKRGYVDITGWVWGSRIIKYGSPRDTFTTVTQFGKKSFNCNYLPIIDDDQIRKALAFLREGRRLRKVHEPYSFLSFFKVIESQLTSDDRKEWIGQNLSILEGDAAKRIAELQASGVDVNLHLFQSGRCAVAHASLGGSIVDPDVPADRKRIAADLDIIAALADHYISVEGGVPNEMDVYKSRDRLAPWHPFLAPHALAALKAGGKVEDVGGLGRLDGARVSVRLWPDSPAVQFQAMTLLPLESRGGVVKFVALNPRKTIVLVFAMDVANGRLHTILNEGGIDTGADISEQDVEDYTRYFHSVIGNRIVEVTLEGVDPVQCEVVIPVNIVPRAPEEAVTEAVEHFRKTKG